MPWRIATDDYGAMQTWWSVQDLMNLALDAYYYYSGHWNWELAANGYLWWDMFWALATIPGDWQWVIGDNGFGEADGIVPWVSSDYPSGTRPPRRLYCSQLCLYHVAQLDPVPNHDADPFRQEVSDAVDEDLGIFYPPPPPPCGVSLTGPGSASAYTWVSVGASLSGCAPPVTYAWTIDGYPACGNESTCGGWVGAEGTYTTFAVTVTPAQGSAAYGSLSVWVPYGGGCETGCREKVKVPKGISSTKAGTPVKPRAPIVPSQKVGPVRQQR